MTTAFSGGALLVPAGPAGELPADRPRHNEAGDVTQDSVLHQNEQSHITLPQYARAGLSSEESPVTGFDAIELRSSVWYTSWPVSWHRVE